MPSLQPSTHPPDGIDTLKGPGRDDAYNLHDGHELTPGLTDPYWSISGGLLATEIVDNTTTWLQVQADTVRLWCHYATPHSSQEDKSCWSWRHELTATLRRALSIPIPSLVEDEVEEVKAGGDITSPPVILEKDGLMVCSQDPTDKPRTTQSQDPHLQRLEERLKSGYLESVLESHSEQLPAQGPDLSSVSRPCQESELPYHSCELTLHQSLPISEAEVKSPCAGDDLASSGKACLQSTIKIGDDEGTQASYLRNCSARYQRPRDVSNGSCGSDAITALLSIEHARTDCSSGCDGISSADSLEALIVGEFYHSLKEMGIALMEKQKRGSEGRWLSEACRILLPSGHGDASNPFTVLEHDTSSLAESSPPALSFAEPLTEEPSTEAARAATNCETSSTSVFKELLPFEGDSTTRPCISSVSFRTKKARKSKKKDITRDSRFFMATNASDPSQGKPQSPFPLHDGKICLPVGESDFAEVDTSSTPVGGFTLGKETTSHSCDTRCEVPPQPEAAEEETRNIPQPSSTHWGFKFISSRGNEYFCDVDEEYLTDRFNLTGLNTEVQYYQYALDLVTDMFDLECEDDMREQIEKSARHLYGLVHARYIVTTRGLQKMMDKYKKGDFGKCPRVACESQHLLPMGQNDIANVSAVKLYCARCEDLYNPKSQRHAAIDGAYFGTSFHNILFQVYPGLLPPKTQRRYEPRVFGFRVHAYSALARWQADQKDKMKKRLEDMNIETGFEEEDEEQESDIGIESGAEDGDALDDMFEGNRRIAHG